MSLGGQSLTRQVGLGLVWVTLASFASRGISLLRKLILARLLVPADFGLVAYASLIIGVLELFKELGFSSALIYRKEDVDEAANTTFVVVILSSILLYALAWLSAPWIAGFFRNDALVLVLRVLSLSLVISAISQVPLTLMAKGMGFKKKVIPEMIGGVVGASISVVLALVGYGVWSIIYGQLITAMIIALVVWFFCPWRPRLRVNLAVAKELWEYGKHIIGSQIMVFFVTNIDDAFVGRFDGNTALGTYSLAYDLSNLPATHLSRVVSQVMFPAFSRVQSDAARLANAFFKSMKYVSLAAFPIAMITMVFAENFIVEAYGKKWFPAVLPLQLMTVYGLARAIAVNMGNVFKAGGKPKWLLYIAGWRLLMMAAFLYPAIQWRGIIGVAALSAVVSVVDFCLSLFLTNRIVRAPWRSYIEILLPMLIAALGTALLAHQLYIWSEGLIHPFISLPLTGGLALAMYLALMYIYDPELRYLIGKATSVTVRDLRLYWARRQATSHPAGKLPI
jgi:O-antigen/teichoic acid export membrane protein